MNYGMLAYDPILAKWVRLIGGGFILLIGVFQIVSETNRYLFAERTEGVAVEIRRAKQEYTIFEYRIANVAYHTQSLSILDEIGKKHAIHYWQSDPSSGYVANGDYFRGALLIAIGGIFLALGRSAEDRANR
jgi:hypothetical protein